ncbi:MAG: response regulator [Proteobacteria bacterium]|nr:response regulator [Desulfobulbaceae bacterium]MBU4151758.1 response regulator [Pseudomonadota bacterium]
MKNISIKILVVDDELFIQDLLRSILESSGHKITVAKNGLEALRLLAQDDYGIVLMDSRMPEMDGLTAVKFLRACEQGDHHSLAIHPELASALHARRMGTRIPVVGITANIDDRGIMLRAGMDEFIPKPFELERLFDLLNKFCGKSKDEAAVERRKHYRYAIKDNSVFVCDGQIGHVVDISDNGLAITYMDHQPTSKKWKAMLLNKVNKVSIPDLQFKIARVGKVGVSQPMGVTTQTIGAIFYNPDSSQQDQIRQFIHGLS